MKPKTNSSENKSDAAKKLGGQPENDQDARDAGVATAASPAKPKKTKQTPGGDSIRSLYSLVVTAGIKRIARMTG